MNEKMKWKDKEAHQTAIKEIMKKWMMDMMEKVRKQMAEIGRKIITECDFVLNYAGNDDK